ncbi:MAG: OadG family protein [Oscillospiraceae bacterium]|nr:OadG family protein [Oscillospiraceae bacterium]
MDLINLTIGSGAGIAVLGYCVVFLGIVMLMLVVMLLCRIMIAKAKKEAAANPVPDPVEPLRVIPAPAPGTAGDLKLYDTDPRDAAMIMAIVADTLGKPLNELRFISIKEVKDE